MTARIMFSHTREIAALTVPFMTVVIVVSLMTAGAIDNATIQQTELPQEQASQILIVEPSSTPPAFANSVEVLDIPVSTPSSTPTSVPTLTPTPTNPTPSPENEEATISALPILVDSELQE